MSHLQKTKNTSEPQNQFCCVKYKRSKQCKFHIKWPVVNTTKTLFINSTFLFDSLVTENLDNTLLKLCELILPSCFFSLKHFGHFLLRHFGYWNISVICLTVVWKLAVAVFISLYFLTFSPSHRNHLIFSVIWKSSWSVTETNQLPSVHLFELHDALILRTSLRSIKINSNMTL